MNRTRRAALNMIVNNLHEMLDGLEAVRDEEQDAFDNMPESIQESERGDTMQEIIDQLDDAVTSLEDAIDSIENIF